MRIFTIKISFPLVKEDSGSEKDTIYIGTDSRQVVLQDETYVNNWVKGRYPNGEIQSIHFGDVV